MTAANEMYDTNMREMANSVISDADETTEEQDSFLFHDEEVRIVSCWSQNTEISSLNEDLLSLIRQVILTAS